MFDLDKWQEIWSTITANPIRSIMTGFGVFWGIFMLVILIGIGNAFEGGLMKNLDGFASNSCFFFTNVTSEPYKGFRKGRWWNMNNKDVVLVKERATALEYVSPMLFGESSSKNVVNGRKSTDAQVVGVYPEFFKIQTQTVLRGRLFNELDIKNTSKVALIGKTIYESLFDSGTDPIGQYIRVNGIYFQVVGIIRPNSRAQIGSDAETSVYIPFSTMQRAFNQGDRVHFMGATAKPDIPATVLEDQIKMILKSNHDIAPNDEKAVRSFNIEKEFKAFSYLFIGIGIIIWFVGIVSLLAGIIGVSNIMLVTVRERTREIGVRRALGAKPLTIVSQILSESFVLTLIAGFVGLLLGVLALEAIGSLLQNAGKENPAYTMSFIVFWITIVLLFIFILSRLLTGIFSADGILNLVFTFVASIIGLLCGTYLFDKINTFFMGMNAEDTMFIPPFISFWVAVISLTILIISGLLAGILPANRALSIKAIDAIREE